ncbi:chemotaxis protein CheB [uncultured Paludibaculum sp.]|uniref:chemotaxis protein CheB n=1 Tax=uncultured Paludibaculum sp. TaxID=1765020 RepID=UPI002AAC0F11|nr:chemotaxis protein CheB [uncultured Paludibaculum sp.]
MSDKPAPDTDPLAPATPDPGQPAHEEGPEARPAIPVVGIGASAGGLEVFKRLLAELPGDTGLAIVFVQHLEPNHPSMLSQILSRITSMPVNDATDGTIVEANHVYVIPANVDLTIQDGALRLATRTQTPGMHMPIDRFLRSMAKECGNRAIAVILSGTGTDGSGGVEAIKAAGGVTFAQDEASAKFASMPQAAIATGCVDFVLRPEEIAAELARVSHHSYMARPPRPQEDATGDEEHFGGILAVLRAATGIDFSLYREKMIKRRILRRLALCNIGSLQEYGERLKNDANELVALQRDLLIGVTSFFRDLESFECLKTIVFPRLVQGRRATEAIRVWVAGCATGEEAFSIAISLDEFFSETGVSFPVQIFASDISVASIEKARTGTYSENIEADLSRERLNRYFTKIDGGYRIKKSLREMCVFTRHNLIDDPPFSKVDLISCRNVLIYLGGVQKDILPVFHFALNPAGFLLLGASEAAASGDLFSVADREHRIFSKRGMARRPPLFHGSTPVPRRGVQRSIDWDEPAPEPWNSSDVRKEVDRILLSKFSPAGVVVDENMEVLEVRGQANRYLTLPAGKVSFSLIKLISDTGLFLEVEKLIQQAQKSGEPARQERVTYEFEGSPGEVTVEALPLISERSRSTLVLFEPAQELTQDPPRPAGEPMEGDSRDRQIARLKQQLAEAKQRFLAAVEAHQSSREEIQTNTEEALSANEELQSLNEELETAKEELQSTNEELITVNDELQAKNAALAQARDFAMSIVETVRQPLLVLDTKLTISMANRAFYQTFRVSSAEAEGQPIFSLTGGSWDVPELRKALEILLQSGSAFPDLEVDKDFPRVGRRSLVMGGCRINHLKMILLAVDDVTERKLTQLALRNSEEHLRQAQKMEAVGRLAGGIAHDFNNLLTTILGYSDLLEDLLANQESAVHQVRQIKAAGERAAALTHRLLAFSRRQVLQPKVLDLNHIVADFDNMLRRLVGERIAVRIDCQPKLWPVRADPGEIGRAVMNLALNARDAMPGGGSLTIKTANVTLSEAEAKEQLVAAGAYVALTICDTGIGFDEEIRAHIFEPFFTTKVTGKGTGLGLATVLGIVEQSGGTIHCESNPGVKTEFTILLPAVNEAVAVGSAPAMSIADAPRGTEVILLVEDEAIVRILARRILESFGYVVFEAADGREGLTFCETHPGQIDLLLSDVVMPELGGRGLAEGAMKVRPGLKVLFMSGHTQDTVLKEGILKGTPFLQKPFTPVMLAQKVRETLGSSAKSAGQG